MTEPRYVFGPSRGGWLFIHRRDCHVLEEFGVYRECPPEVVALVQVTKEQADRLPTTRNLGLCGHCFREEVAVVA